MTKLALTGTTGNLGKLIVRQLLCRIPAHKLAVIVRRPEAAEEWRLQGVDVRYGDYDHPEGLEASFQGISKLLLISSPHPDDDTRLRQHKDAIASAKKAGVQHLIYTGIVCPERGRLPLHRLHLLTEQAIQDSGLPYTILRNAYYMDIVKLLGVREAAAGGELWSPPGQWTFNTAAREDLALAAVTVMTEDGHRNRTYELTASQVWKLDDLAHALTEVTGRRVVYRTNPDMNSPIYKMLALADMKFVSPELAKLINRPLRTVQDEVRAMFDPASRP
jgi:NAD(P)H dehydrogenase (quinone)